MQSLADIKSLLAAHCLRPKHRFGQNFLHDARKFAVILEAAAVQPDDLILEVGPGTGALTERLLEAGARVVAVEIDRHFESLLRQRLAPYADRCTLLFEDILAGKHTINPQVWTALHPGDSPSPKHPTQVPFKLIANLPYNVASPLLANLAADHPAMRLAVVLIQWEVAQRLIAPPGGKDYGPLGVLIQALLEVECLAKLSPGCFWPPPEVDSAVVRLIRRAQPLTADPHALSAFLQRLFTKRRKQLRGILGRDFPWPADIDPTTRPEQLSVSRLVALADLVG